jgi:hypothetical protein
VDRTPEDEAARTKTFLADKLYALDRDKAEFRYQMCRAIDARRVVELGTSYGVSTLYLAAAVRDNIRAGGGSGVVIGTEYEPEKARAARANFSDAGLSSLVGNVTLAIAGAMGMMSRQRCMGRCDGCRSARLRDVPDGALRERRACDCDQGRNGRIWRPR